MDGSIYNKAIVAGLLGCQVDNDTIATDNNYKKLSTKE